MRKAILYIIVLGIGIGGAVFFVTTRPRPEQSPHQAQGPIVEVSGAIFSPLVMTVEGYGTVEAKREVTKTAEVSGQVNLMSPKAEEGMFFKKGELLVEIDPRTYRLAVKKARSTTDQGRADLELINQEIANNEKNLELAEEELTLSEKEWKRQKDLKATDVASESTVDAARRQFLQVKNKKQSIENALATLKPRKAAAQARLDMALTQLEEAELNLSKTKIHAPFDGRTARKLVEPGKFVAPGAPLIHIYNSSAMEVSVELPLEDLQWLDLHAPKDKMRQILIRNHKNNLPTSETEKRGKDHTQPFPGATAFLDTGGPEISWEGYVSRLGGIMDTATRTLPIFVEIPEPLQSSRGDNDWFLAPGMFVRIEIKGKAFPHVLELPRSAVRSDNTVYIAQKGLLTIRPVHILRKQGNTAYIDQGIKAGEKVITSPLTAATDGMKIRLIEELGDQEQDQ